MAAPKTKREFHPRIINPITLHTVVPKGMRAYLTALYSHPDLAPTLTLAEIFTKGVIGFLSERPYLEPGFSWVRPPGRYYYVDGIRMTRDGWYSLNPKLMDLEDKNGKIVTSEVLHDSLKALSASVPRKHGMDNGMSAVVYTVLTWMCTDMFPPKKYGFKMDVLPVEVSAQEMKPVTSRAKATAVKPVSKIDPDNTSGLGSKVHA